MKKSVKSSFVLFFIILLSYVGAGQTEKVCKFIVAGHAYGAHGGSNIGLHPPLLKKLALTPDSSINTIFLTGDIVNKSNPESWAQVDKELDSLGLESFYVMGNHDDNYTGYEVFRQKHGGSYYSFKKACGTFIILNSTESDRSVSSVQLDFLNDILSKADTNSKNVFIFFHEILWNSHEKYKNVRSNSRSRYAQISGYSNFWDEVFPIFQKYPEMEFYLFAGDVGGNPDAIAAFYDKWENVSLIASGMGEVEDENYLLVNVTADTIEFDLIPLREKVEMKSIHYYNVPEKPKQIFGPSKIKANELSITYNVEPVFNATDYHWILSNGMKGVGDSDLINVYFEENFQSGELSVLAVNDGFGESEPAVLLIQRDTLTSANTVKSHSRYFIFQSENYVHLNFTGESESNYILRIYNASGSLLIRRSVMLNQGLNMNIIKKDQLPHGLVIFELTSQKEKHVQKVIVY